MTQKILPKFLVVLGFLALATWAIWSETIEARSAGRETARRPAAVELPDQSDAAWRLDSLWDDGRAEFCAYEVSWARYGTTYSGSAQLILVKEPWAPDLEVKADRARADGFDVLKLNHLRDVRTGVYAYHQMASVYARRDSGALQKLAATSSEACGISTAQMVAGRLETRSYFDGQGEHSREYPAAALPEDGLPLYLRSWVAAEPPGEVKVLPSLMAGRFHELEPLSYGVTRREIGLFEVPAGSFDAVELELAGAAGDQRFVFETAAPHRLLALRRADDTEYRLAKCERIPYWQMHRPGDEAWLPETLR